MIVLKLEQIMRAESEHGARSVRGCLGDCYSTGEIKHTSVAASQELPASR